MTLLEEIAHRRVGTVHTVAPNLISVSLELDAPQGVALSSGTPTRFPRVNGFITIPTESGSVIGLINWLGIEPSPFPKRPGYKDYGLIDLPYPARRMRVTPLGMLRRESAAADLGSPLVVQRGVLSLPSVGDPVLLPTEPELAAIVEGQATGPRVLIGRAALARELDVRVEPDRLFGRHVAVLGNTGAGKSCSVAGLVRWSLEEAMSHMDNNGLEPNARFVVIDPNGEYGPAFKDFPGARLFQVEGFDEVENPLRVPAWLWNADEWSGFSDAAAGVQRPLLHQALRGMRFGETLEEPGRRRLASQVSGFIALLSEAIALGPTTYASFPGKQDLGQVLLALGKGLAAQEGQMDDPAIDDEVSSVRELVEALVDEKSNESKGRTYWDAFAEPELARVQEALQSLKAHLPEWEPPSGPSEDAPIPFDVNDLVAYLEFLASEKAQIQFVGSLNLRIRTLLSNPRMSTVVAPTGGPESISEWLSLFLGDSGDQPTISIIDLSLLPPDLLHVVTAVTARLVFEATQRYRKHYGKPLPTVLVLEEAHHFVHRSSTSEAGAREAAVMCRRTIERIAREGRKFGLGLVLSSQRPSEVSPTVLSQCNTFLLHRIVNDKDQELVRRLVPDNLAGLLDDLPSLPTQHAILLGSAAPAPLLVQVRNLDPGHRPRSSDPDFWRVWTHQEERAIDWSAIAEEWVN